MTRNGALFQLKLLACCCFLAITAQHREALAQDSMDSCIKASEDGNELHKNTDLIGARTAWSACAASTCPAEVADYCRSRLVQVTKAIPSIVLAAKDGGGRDLLGVKLTIDGVGHPEGIAIELNPGRHTFLFEAPGQQPVTRDFILSEGERDRRETIVIGPVPSDVKVASGEHRQASSGIGTQRTLALVVAGAGVTSLIAAGA